MARPGQPTKYKPEYCQEIIEFRTQGYSWMAWCGQIGINIDTFYEWQKRHKEFSEATKRADMACLKTWESIGIQMALGKVKGNGLVYVYRTANLFRMKRQDVEEIESKDVDGFVFIEDKSDAKT